MADPAVHLDIVREYSKRNNLRKFSVAITMLLIAITTGYIIYGNFVPFGSKKYYTSLHQNEISQLSPKNRVLGIQFGQEEVQRVIDDLVYFTSYMPYKFEKSEFKITFRNPYPDQELYLGFKDQDKWHYDSKLIDSPILNGGNWNVVGNMPYLYQKNNTYTSVDEFLTNPPKDAIIGLYDYDPELLKQFETRLADYAPSTSDTIISTPLRGKHVMYVYLDGEPFKMTITKKDMNWYEDPDVMNIRVYKDVVKVYEASIDDDGVTDNSGKISSAQEVTIQNPGPGIPEPGVYKVILDANEDTIITSIRTNLHKIVFESPIFPAENADVYSKIFSKTVPSTFYSDALSLSAITYHDGGKQTINIGDKDFKISDVKLDFTSRTPEGLFKISVPSNDVIIRGTMGYFAASPDQFFRPSEFYLLPISSRDDADIADYILTNYMPSQKEGDWQVATASFDLSNAVINSNHLSWLIKTPKLKDNQREIDIKSFEAIFEKKPILKFDNLMSNLKF